MKHFFQLGLRSWGDRMGRGEGISGIQSSEMWLGMGEGEDP